ncbi:MAG: DNA repair protein RadA [Pseudomonadota bacterium]|nr:DNA repair protein RadA [Pseudomonadota bacterium]
MKLKVAYTCQECGASFSKWSGQCSNCKSWNTIVEESSSIACGKHERYSGYAGSSANEVTALSEVTVNEKSRISLLCSEFDRVLGGGLVAGSVVMLGGDPGIGKTTLLLQTLATLAQQQINVLYVTGEESLEQIGLRARQIKIPMANMYLLAETQVEIIIAKAKKHQPTVIVIDSIQTVYSSEIQSAPGCVAQVRESAMRVVQFAKQTGITIFLIGHVTKEGALAGPRVLEHMVDTVLYFEGDTSSRFRMVRAIKNRFGAVGELGVFAMTDNGLKAISNPSAIFLSQQQHEVAGSAIMVSWEGTRPLLLEVQALVDDSNSSSSHSRRLALGIDNSRLGMLLALMNRYLGLHLHSTDIFVNIVGGMKVTETAVDLAIIAALISSQRDRPIPTNVVIFGEIGLGGEIRPVQNGMLRIMEAAKHGFIKAIIPKSNAPKKKISGFEIITLDNLRQLSDHL